MYANLLHSDKLKCPFKILFFIFFNKPGSDGSFLSIKYADLNHEEVSWLSACD